MTESLAPRRRPVFRVEVAPNEGVGFYGMFDRMPTPDEVFSAFSLAEAQGRLAPSSSALFGGLCLELCLERLPEPPIIGELSTAYYVNLPMGRLVVTREYLNLTDIESR
jgi:hypothetical protein